MDMNMLIGLASGAVGGNVAGGLLKNFSQGTLVNSIAGIAGGGIGAQLLGGMLGGGADASGMMSIVSQVVSGGAGGGVLLAIVGIVKNMLSK